MRFNPDDYIDVQARINQFWGEYPDGAIQTALVSDPNNFERVVFRADVYKHRDDGVVSATGYAAEMKGTGGANNTSWHENGETSAIGRALANLGYATSHADRPSRQEMQKVSRMEAQDPAPPARTGFVAQPVARSPQPPQPRPGNGNPYPITDRQRGLLYKRAKELWGDDDDSVLHRFIKAQHGVESVNDLSKQQASSVIDTLLKEPDGNGIRAYLDAPPPTAPDDDYPEVPR